MNKGACYNFLKVEESISDKELRALMMNLNTFRDLVRFEKKYPILRKLLFHLNGFKYLTHEKMYVNCWLLLENEQQIAKLDQISSFFQEMIRFRNEAIISFFLNKMNNGSCKLVDLNNFLIKHKVPMVKSQNPIVVSKECVAAVNTIYKFLIE